MRRRFSTRRSVSASGRGWRASIEHASARFHCPVFQHQRLCRRRRNLATMAALRGIHLVSQLAEMLQFVDERPPADAQRLGGFGAIEIVLT